MSYLILATMYPLSYLYGVPGNDSCLEVLPAVHQPRLVVHRHAGVADEVPQPRLLWLLPPHGGLGTARRMNKLEQMVV